MEFYDAVLGALGYVRLWTGEKGLGYGRRRGEAEPLRRGGGHAARLGLHLAFDAPDRESVKRFHAQALQQGGVDQGTPGPRPQFGPTYYAAFVIDPDGYKLEAVHQ